jgi:hypothetical protein
VIEFDGVYRDRDLYNYFVGCRYPAANWTEEVRPRPMRYRARDLDKVRLSVPCFMRDVPVIRRAARASQPRDRLEREIDVENGADRPRPRRGIGRPGTRSCRRPGRPLEVNCLVGPTHPQRIDAVRGRDGFLGGQRHAA